MEQLDDVVDQVADALSEVARSEVVVGTPLEVGGVTVVPISRVSAGFAGAGGEGEGDVPASGSKGKGPQGSGKGRGTGSGAGAIVRPVAVVAFQPDGVEVLPIPERHGKIERLLDQLPNLVDRFTNGKSSR